MHTIQKTRSLRPAGPFVGLVLAGSVLFGGVALGAELTATVTPRDVTTPDGFTRIVKVGDLDLRTETGVEALRKRVRTVAAEGCRALHSEDILSVSLRMQIQGSCVRSSLRNVTPQIDRAVRVAAEGGTAPQVAFVFSR